MAYNYIKFHNIMYVLISIEAITQLGSYEIARFYYSIAGLKIIVVVASISGGLSQHMLTVTAISCHISTAGEFHACIAITIQVFDSLLIRKQVYDKNTR